MIAKNIHDPGKKAALSDGHQIGLSSGLSIAICFHQLRLPMLKIIQIEAASRRRGIILDKAIHSHFE